MKHYIYSITNIINNKKYIGETENLEERKRKHFQAGLRGYHDIRKFNGNKLECNGLYKDMKQLGLNNFTFEILEVCSYEEKLNKEKYWINKFNSYKNGYNCVPYHGGWIETGRKDSEETRLKKSKAKLGHKNYNFIGHFYMIDTFTNESILFDSITSCANFIKNEFGYNISHASIRGRLNNRLKNKLYKKRYKFVWYNAKD